MFSDRSAFVISCKVSDSLATRQPLTEPTQRRQAFIHLDVDMTCALRPWAIRCQRDLATRCSEVLVARPPAVSRDRSQAVLTGPRT
jgi:hypothetical protein